MTRCTGLQAVCQGTWHCSAIKNAPGRTFESISRKMRETVWSTQHIRGEAASSADRRYQAEFPRRRGPDSILGA